MFFKIKRSATTMNAMWIRNVIKEKTLIAMMESGCSIIESK